MSYTLAYSRGNTSGAGAAASPFQVLDDLNLDLNEGPTSFDQRHNLVVSGTALVPKTGGLTVSWVARALSGSPFTVFNSTVTEKLLSVTAPRPKPVIDFIYFLCRPQPAFAYGSAARAGT